MRNILISKFLLIQQKNTEYNTVLNTALQAGEGPDIFHLRPYAAGLKLAEAGFVEKN